MKSRSGKVKIDLNVSSDVLFDQRVIKTARALQDHGYAVRITGRQRYSKAEKMPQGLNVQLLKSLPRQGIAFYFFLNLWLFLRGLFSKADLFIAVDLDTLPGTWCAAVLKRKKVILDAHEHYVESPELVDRPLKKKIWGLVANWFIPRVDLAFTVNKELSNKMGDLYKMPFKVIRNMPIQQHIAFHSKREKVIWYQGAVNQGRMLNLLIDALDHLHGFHIEIAGDGDLTSDLKQYALLKNKQNRVVFHGRMEYSDMQERAAHCMIGYNMLSDEGENYKYSLANKFFDYVQSGLPSINSSFPVYQRYLTDFETGVAVSYDLSSLELANIILEMTSNPANYNRYTQNCYKAREVWIWENEKQILLTEINNLMG